MLSADTTDDTTYIKTTSTKIFTGKTVENRQLVVYQTDFDFLVRSRKPMALIIPVPANNLDDISIVSIDEKFFNNNFQAELTLDSFILPEGTRNTKPPDYNPTNSKKTDIEKLDISVCVNVHELLELSKKFFINDVVLKAITNKYSGRKFAFVVAQILPSMKHKTGIFAYTHNMLRHGTLFIPGYIVNSQKVAEMEVYDHTFYIHNSIINKVAQGHIDIAVVGIIKNFSLLNYKVPDGYLSIVRYNTLRNLNEDFIATEIIYNKWLITNIHVISNGKYIAQPYTNTPVGIENKYKGQDFQTSMKTDDNDQVVNDEFFGNTTFNPNIFHNPDVQEYDPYRFQSENWNN